jgi:hypothetical protein
VLVARNARGGKLIRQLPFDLGPADTPHPAASDEQTGNIYFPSDPHTVSVLSPSGWRIVQRVHVAGAIRLLAVAQRARRVVAVTSAPDGAMLTVFCAEPRCR